MLTHELRSGLSRRGVSEHYERYRDYTATLLERSAATNTFSDKTGNCRLEFVDTLLRHPTESLAMAEAFTWNLHQRAQSPQNGMARLLAAAGNKLDLTPRPPLESSSISNPLRIVIDAVESADEALARAYAPLSPQARADLETHLYDQSTGKIRVGHAFADRALGREVCDRLEEIDYEALLDAARALAQLTEPRLLNALAALVEPPSTAGGRNGNGMATQITCRAGTILVGGRGPNRYVLEEMQSVCMVLDLGGDDTYVEGTVGRERPLLVLVDLGGNDVFRGEKPGIQGGAVLGASLLVARGGTNRFEALDIAQGSTLGGLGLLVASGDNHYLGRSRVQGQAVGGVGILMDRDGNDNYRAAFLSQGVGGPLGFGLLIDLAGQDHYYAGGLYDRGYDDSPGYGGWSQGIGAGPRGSANGGIGVLLDGGGDDLYEYDYFSHGGGYWFAAGFARDFGGNDQRIGSTRTAFDGGERTEKPFVRWGVGYGCHYAVGYLIDDEGDDFYKASTAAIGFAWDIAVGALMDFEGNDTYQGPGGGHASNAGLGVLFDGGGNDRYTGGRLGLAQPNVNYHPADQAGGNFALLVDYGGDDDFGKELENNMTAERGWAGGFFISRPKPPRLRGWRR